MFCVANGHAAHTVPEAIRNQQHAFVECPSLQSQRTGAYVFYIYTVYVDSKHNLEAADFILLLLF